MAGKLKFAQNLYLGEGIAPEKLDKLKKRLNKKPLLANVYLITPARNPADQLDIFDARQLVQPHYKDEEFLVLGMASGYVDTLHRKYVILITSSDKEIFRKNTYREVIL